MVVVYLPPLTRQLVVVCRLAHLVVVHLLTRLLLVFPVARPVLGVVGRLVQILLLDPLLVLQSQLAQQIAVLSQLTLLLVRKKQHQLLGQEVQNHALKPRFATLDKTAMFSKFDDVK